ncbi:MAG TPA: PP2C family protein-serine/threonine phosphatase [Miltoncostaeaceae bacterium]|nr:PP2C family protein-serine/threonine phosphatase [Miltoncostaeaceae bacterium]
MGSLIPVTDATAPTSGDPGAERMLLDAVEAAPLGIGVLDEELRLVRANTAFGRALDGRALAPLAVEALTRDVELRVDDTARQDEDGRWRVRLFPLSAGHRPSGGVGALVDDVEGLVAAERAGLAQLVAQRALAQETIDALASELAILDEAGRIITVNRAWRDFSAANDGIGDFVGDDYLAACSAPAGGAGGEDDPAPFVAGLADLLAGRTDLVEFEYPCHSPTEQRWFLARAVRFETGGSTRVVVTHENITARHRSQELHRHIARTLQASLLPEALPAPPGLELAARYRAQGEGVEVGGDFYDVFQEGADWLMVIGDVCGKGPEAAAVTAEARWTIRALADTTTSPAELMAAVNALLLRRRRDHTFLSAAVVRAAPAPGGARLCVARAGHPFPVVLRAGGGVETVGGDGSLLGLFAEARFGEAEVVLAPGDAMVLYTDGASEARRPGGSELGLDGVAGALAGARGLDATAVADRLERAALAHGGGRLRDDLAILVVRAVPSPPPTPRPRRSP